MPCPSPTPSPLLDRPTNQNHSCIPCVTSLADSANLASLTLYSSIVAAAVFAVARCDTAVMWGLALIVVPFLPASNILFPVGAVVAERVRTWELARWERGRGETRSVLTLTLRPSTTHRG